MRRCELVEDTGAGAGAGAATGGGGGCTTEDTFTERTPDAGQPSLPTAKPSPSRHVPAVPGLLLGC